MVNFKILNEEVVADFETFLGEAESYVVGKRITFSTPFKVSISITNEPLFFIHRATKMENEDEWKLESLRLKPTGEIEFESAPDFWKKTLLGEIVKML